jgi:hypothetical protein
MEKEELINLKTNDIQKATLEAQKKSMKLLEEQGKFNRWKRKLNSDSPLWKCIGFAQIEGVNGRNHNQFIYDEK